MIPEEVAGTLSYITTSWGRPLTTAHRLAYSRLFAQNSVELVMEAIDDFRDRNVDRPNPAQLAARIRAARLDEIRNEPKPEIDVDKLRANYGRPAEPWPPPGTTPAYASEAFKAARALVP